MHKKIRLHSHVVFTATATDAEDGTPGDATGETVLGSDVMVGLMDIQAEAPLEFAIPLAVERMLTDVNEQSDGITKRLIDKIKAAGTDASSVS